MSRTFVVVLLLIAGTATAFAASKWNGAGWYQIWTDGISAGIHAGPFSDEAACRATLPANNDLDDYECEYVAKKPQDE